MQIRATIRRHPVRFGVLAFMLLALGAFAIYWFGPQYLFIDRRVDEAVPTVAALPAAESPAATGDQGTGQGGESAPTASVTLARGEFRGLEHDSTGTALVLELPDGSRFLRLEDLDTSNGPDLRVYLSDAPASDDWYVYDDGEFVDLGGLKGNMGSSNYEIPSELDLTKFESAVVWCRRFSVGFAVAPLLPTS
ncbi:MAG: DM13 domain-containing protein [Actinomycetota bacterium]